MAWALHVYTVDPGDDTVKVEHIFYGLTRAEAQDYYGEHLKSCNYFRPAEEEGRNVEEWVEIEEDEIPELDLDDTEDDEDDDG
jgi:hypothetical protein